MTIFRCQIDKSSDKLVMILNAWIDKEGKNDYHLSNNQLNLKIIIFLPFFYAIIYNNNEECQ